MSPLARLSVRTTVRFTLRLNLQGQVTNAYKVLLTLLGVHWSSVEPRPSLPNDPLPQVYKFPDSENKKNCDSRKIHQLKSRFCLMSCIWLLPRGS